jgi:hypothetical protein
MALAHKRWQRRLLRIGMTILVIFIVYNFIILPRLLRWGATKEEFNRSLPGDEWVQQKDYKNTLAVTVNTPASAIWPWVAQMGLHKAGLYTYTWLENMFGCKLHNADRIHPEWQNPKAGEIEPVCKSQEGKPNSGWLVVYAEPNKMLVWRGMNDAQWMMGIYIDSIDDHTSRLITRQQFKSQAAWSKAWWIEKLWFEWAHSVMQHGMISGIKKRVENNKGGK